MSKIIKNLSGSAYQVVDVGYTLAIGENYTIPPTDYLLWAASSNAVTGIGAADLVVNDGSGDLSISDGIDLLKFVYQKNRIIGNTDGTLIGNVGDALKTTASISVQTSSSDFMLDVSAGRKTGISQVNKFGRNPQVPGSGFVTIWDGEVDYPWDFSAGTLSVFSSDAADSNPSGIGGRTLEIQGLDVNYVLITETVNLNGTTPVITTNSFLKVYRAKVMSGGSNKRNVGDISMTRAGTLVAQIIAEESQTLMAIYTVPAAFTGYISQYYWGQGKDKEVNIKIEVRPFGGVFQTKNSSDAEDGHYMHGFKPYLKVLEKSDIQIRAKSKVTDHGLSAGFALYLENN